MIAVFVSPILGRVCDLSSGGEENTYEKSFVGTYDVMETDRFIGETERMVAFEFKGLEGCVIMQAEPFDTACRAGLHV